MIAPEAAGLRPLIERLKSTSDSSEEVARLRCAVADGVCLFLRSRGEHVIPEGSPFSADFQLLIMINRSNGGPFNRYASAVWENFGVESVEVPIGRPLTDWEGAFHASPNRIRLPIPEVLSGSPAIVARHESDHAGFHQQRVDGIESPYHGWVHFWRPFMGHRQAPGFDPNSTYRSGFLFEEFFIWERDILDFEAKSLSDASGAAHWLWQSFEAQTTRAEMLKSHRLAWNTIGPSARVARLDFSTIRLSGDELVLRSEDPRLTWRLHAKEHSGRIRTQRRLLTVRLATHPTEDFGDERRSPEFGAFVLDSSDLLQFEDLKARLAASASTGLSNLDRAFLTKTTQRLVEQNDWLTEL